jgi:hypothetical protein
MNGKGCHCKITKNLTGLTVFEAYKILRSTTIKETWLPAGAIVPAIQKRPNDLE